MSPHVGLIDVHCNRAGSKVVVHRHGSWELKVIPFVLSTTHTIERAKHLLIRVGNRLRNQVDPVLVGKSMTQPSGVCKRMFRNALKRVLKRF